MYISEAKNNTIVFADQVNGDIKKDFRCPGCKRPVFLKQGRKNAAHFSHYSSQACDTFSEGETTEHLSGKKQLYDWWKSCKQTIQLEAYLPELKQRPDLLWVNNCNEKVAIEFQCSSLSMEKMLMRTESYINAGYKVLWIMGKNFHLKEKPTTFQKLFMMEYDKAFYYMQYDVDKKELQVLSHFQTTAESTLVFKKTIFRPEKDILSSMDDLFKRLRYPENKKQMQDYQSMHLNLLRASYHRTPAARKFFQAIYENNEDIVSMPIELYWNVPNEWMVAAYSFQWKYACLKWVESFQKRRVITIRMVKEWVATSLKNRTLSFYVMPMTTESVVLKPVVEFLELLTKSKVLKETKKNKWTVLKKANRFNHIREKEQLFNYHYAENSAD